MQTRSLIRTRHLAAYRAALTTRALGGDPLDARRRLIIVPSRAAAEVLRQTIEADAAAQGRAAIVLPDFVTRDEWLQRLQALLPTAPPLLPRIERELLLERAAHEAASRRKMGGRPFGLRPGLVAGMLDFYDELQRRRRNVRRFARALFDQLRGERGTDRGTDGLIHQTGFLGFTFLAYERGVAASGGIDEHGLRRLLLREQPALPVDHVIVAVADHPTDPRGLWPADFDLLGRLRHLSRLEVIVTDETHDAGFRERIDEELPGIEEARDDAVAAPVPIVVRPAGSDDAVCEVSRDREEELRDVVRRIRGEAAAGQHELREAIAVVFARRLPYLYLAGQVFEDAGVPYQTFDALPLAAEPWAALLDLVLSVARTGGTRETIVALLRSRLIRLEVDGVPVGLRDAAALDIALRERRTSGEADVYPREVEAWFGDRSTKDRVERERAVRAARAAAAVRDALLPFRGDQSASAQVRALSTFLRRMQHPGAVAGPAPERSLRARAAVLGVLDALASGFEKYDDRPRDPDALTGLIHHLIEGQTFSPRRGNGGVHLVDAVAARFGRFDHIHIVGLVETEWPERTRRSIFYTSGLLKVLGWPQELDVRKSQMAEFRDLLGLASTSVSLHAFQLEGDAIVAPSPMIDAARELPARQVEAGPAARMFSDEVLAIEPSPATGLSETAAAWLELRRLRPPLSDPRYSGLIRPRPAGDTPPSYRVSRVDHYVACPFKYFAESVLDLKEDRDEMSGLTPLERGTLVHEIFETFYLEWQREGRSTITPATMPEAIARFADLTRAALARYPEADRALEETRLLGSIVARGLAERVFELESDAGGVIVDRLIETDLRGPFDFMTGFKASQVHVRGKADRIDVFSDGSLRVIDYKTGRQPDKSSIQIGVYAHCAAQLLQRADGRSHRIAAAMYLAFGDDDKLEGGLGNRNEPTDVAVSTRAGEFAAYVERIESGQFPARPRRPGECQYCGYAGVCRKEYRLEDAEEAGE